MFFFAHFRYPTWLVSVSPLFCSEDLASIDSFHFHFLNFKSYVTFWSNFISKPWVFWETGAEKRPLLWFEGESTRLWASSSSEIWTFMSAILVNSSRVKTESSSAMISKLNYFISNWYFYHSFTANLLVFFLRMMKWTENFCALLVASFYLAAV
jgi:hypothetical protein